ncbi:uncharacterized protein FA14DRAFT_175198 [Meira miltonrushii]|uniref:DUF3835 domain-containing protein n=1 Tax=Meira miltonrushii TaxID=1280837 RepID=A0A316V4L8_9BASI|nr:uncharacterized protein FA14DRAFT_175198 [Meira miltonrushii]PWN32402.1 hypothetical protein FA14DRAFT_175198 [Meira miltonrushii]
MNENDQIINENGQTLNEEGLPFINVTEQIAEQDDRFGKGVVQTFRPTEEKSKEERKIWMNSILNQLEQDEGEENVIQKHLQTEQNSQKSSHTRVSSADRPLPSKSVLKHTFHNVSPDPKFGASGIRKGFLNMNPSSPAAEHSSDPIEQVRWMAADDNMSASTSSLGSMADQMTNADERMSRSGEIGGKVKKKKKSVRIQSPEGVRESKSVREELVGSIRETKKIGSDVEDEGNEEEAKMIVELLGIDSIKGHPQYESIKQSMKAQEDEARRSTEQANAKYQSTGKATDGVPSVRKEVIEHAPGKTSALPSSSKSRKDSSAFKMGFLNVKPKQYTKPPLPAGPQTTQGISALERATNRDEIISEERIKQGLTPSVPHARPSKAFAEKLEARKRGGTISNELNDIHTENEGSAKMSKVRFGETNDGKVDVQVGTAATEATNKFQNDPMAGIVDDDNSDEDDVMAELGLEVYDEELDEDQVDALGYFSDEDADPDIGFDSDDMVEAIVPPQFDSDAGEINNDDLRREYERIKASLMQQNGFHPSKLSEGQKSGESSMPTDDMEGLNDGQDLSLIEEGADQNANMSRFRRERLHRAMMGKKATSRELGTGSSSSTDDPSAALRNAHNVGPSMLIPALANVRFPKQKEDGTIPTSANEIELDGQSDEEEDRLENVMRARLEQRELNKEEGMKQQSATEHKPPEVLSTSVHKENPPKTAKKTSLFKARMQGQSNE